MDDTIEEKRAKWEGILLDWEATEVSAAAYCRDHGIPRRKFFYWKGRLRKKVNQMTNSIVKPGFVELTDCKPEVSGISLSVNGLIIQLGLSYDEKELLRTLRVLESR